MAMNFLTLNRHDLFRLLVFFLLGFILGGSTITILVSRRMDDLLLEQERLIAMLNEKEQKLTRLEESLATHRQRPVEGVEVFIESPLSRHTLQTLEQRIKEMIYPFFGRPLKELDPLSLLILFEDRLFIIDKQNITVDVELIIIKETLSFYLQAEEAPP